MHHCVQGHAGSNILDEINQSQADLLYASPMHYRMLAADASGKTMPSLKWAISTSAAIPGPVLDAFTDRYALPLTQAYGIIEVGLPIVNHDLKNAHGLTVGLASPGFTVAILDDQGMPLLAGEEGQLAMKGPGMFDAYLTPYQLREEVLQDGWF